MSAKWKYDDYRVAYADGTGTYDEGWYAAAPSTAEAGQSPDAGPFATREEAVKRAEDIKSDEEAQDATLKIGAIIDGADALQTYREGKGMAPLAWPPEIPAGCNTAWWRFETGDGRPALVIRQGGFKRARGEGEVNGISVLVALDGHGEEAYQALERLTAQMLPEVPHG